MDTASLYLWLGLGAFATIAFIAFLIQYRKKRPTV
ncbi:MAG: LPXTG cell wall anchor domain-containing protein [Bacteroidales bacterium]|jgi:LPXTG-motif cell wall-anchored protein|nr:LPXTG cell wall anchor domain-containing protein [Bacteroidales bacterium]